MPRDSLNGVRVIDFSHVLAGPVCTMTLADLGAHVVKIEPPDGEIGRRIGPPWINGESATFISVNRNKYSVAIDLKTEAGREAVLRMVPNVDVLVENFRPGVMASLGLDFAALQRLNSRLIYCSISAFGQKGTGSTRPGVDGVIQAASGFMSTLGTGQSEPLKVTIPIADMMGGYLASIAILGALHEVREGRSGQHLDVSLYNATLMLQQTGFAAYFASGREPEKTGSAAPYACPNEAFPTADGWMMVVAYHQERWRALCEVLASPELESDPRFATNEDRVRHRATLHHTLAAHFIERTSADWIERLSARDILCARVATYDEVVQFPEYAECGLPQTITHPVAGAMRTHGFAFGPSDSHPLQDTPAPLKGQHTFEILKKFGFAEREIGKLLNAGVIHASRASYEDFVGHEVTT